jgi:hypothetical protein
LFDFKENFFFDRYVIDTNRVLFLVQDGSLAYDVKNYLVQQRRCLEVSIDNQAYPGRGAKVRKIHLEFCLFVLFCIDFRECHKSNL